MSRQVQYDNYHYDLYFVNELLIILMDTVLI